MLWQFIKCLFGFHHIIVTPTRIWKKTIYESEHTCKYCNYKKKWSVYD